MNFHLTLAMANLQYYKTTMEQKVKHLNQSESRVVIPQVCSIMDNFLEKV